MSRSHFFFARFLDKYSSAVTNRWRSSAVLIWTRLICCKFSAGLSLAGLKYYITRRCMKWVTRMEQCKRIKVKLWEIINMVFCTQQTTRTNKSSMCWRLRRVVMWNSSLSVELQIKKINFGKTFFIKQFTDYWKIKLILF